MTEQTPTITRLELDETPGNGVHRRMWYEGWQEGDAANEIAFLRGRTLLPLLQEADRRRWSVTQFTPTTACLLRGEIIRVDVTQNAFGLSISQFPYGWKAHTRPLQQEVRAGSIDELIAPYEALGWKVFKWVDGARTFAPGHLYPVRDAQTMLAMRSKLRAQRGELTRLKFGQFIDLAYEL